jgi:hypothetical protein
MPSYRGPIKEEAALKGRTIKTRRAYHVKVLKFI